MIPKDSGRKENWYIRFITLCMSNFNIPESYIYPLKELKDNEHSIDKLVNEQFKALKTPYTEIFKRASKSINKCFAKLIKGGDCKDD